MKEGRTIIIIDDEQSGIDVLTSLIKEFVPEANILGTFNTAHEAVNGIRNLRPDIVFSDIEMLEMSEIELLSLVEDIPFKTVFVIAHQKYAIQAIRQKAFDYLLKPIRIKELMDVFHRINTDREASPLKNGEDTIMLRGFTVFSIPHSSF